MGCGGSTNRPQEPAAAATATSTGGRGGPRSGGRIRHPPPWQIDGGSVTRNQLILKRQTFWESRTEGHTTVWQNLKLAAEAMLENNIDIAITVLDASDIRCPNGDLSLVYDSLGHRYELPRYVFSNPSNIVSDAEMSKMSHSARKPHVGPVMELTLTCRVSSSPTNWEQDVKVTVKSSFTAGQVKMALHEHLASGACDQIADASTPKPNKWAGKGLPPSRQRLLYRGRILDDDVHMQEAQVGPDSILQIFVKVE